MTLTNLALAALLQLPKGDGASWATYTSTAGYSVTYLVGSRLYQVIVAAPKSEFPTDDSERVFRSFRIQGRN